MRDTRTTIEACLLGEDDTLALGRLIGELGAEGLVLALDGDLGTGKTTLVRGIGEGLGLDGGISSPTYTLMQSHLGGRLPLAHFDAWMEGREKALLADGADEFLQSGGIAVVEWASRVEEWLPGDRVVVQLHHESMDSRRAVLTFLGNSESLHGGLMEGLREAYPGSAALGGSPGSPESGPNSTGLE